MTSGQILVLVPGLACFLAFSWGTLRHFRPVGPMPLGMRLIGVISLITFSAFAWSVLTTPLPELWLAAPILSAASLALFIWATRATREAGFALAFAGAQPSQLLVSGPFRYLRHPFYSSYLLFWLATCFATNSALCVVGSVLLLICYLAASRDEEHRIAHGRLADEYASYAAETGMFLPWRRRKRW